MSWERLRNAEAGLAYCYPRSWRTLCIKLCIQEVWCLLHGNNHVAVPPKTDRINRRRRRGPGKRANAAQRPEVPGGTEAATLSERISDCGGRLCSFLLIGGWLYQRCPARSDHVSTQKVPGMMSTTNTVSHRQIVPGGQSSTARGTSRWPK